MLCLYLLSVRMFKRAAPIGESEADSGLVSRAHVGPVPPDEVDLTLCFKGFNATLEGNAVLQFSAGLGLSMVSSISLPLHLEGCYELECCSCTFEDESKKFERKENFIWLIDLGLGMLI